MDGKILDILIGDRKMYREFLRTCTYHPLIIRGIVDNYLYKIIIEDSPQLLSKIITLKLLSFVDRYPAHREDYLFR